MNTGKNYVVLEYFPGFTPRVMREFSNVDDAMSFARLLESSKANSKHTYAVFTEVGA